MFEVGDRILREIVGKTFNVQDSKGPRAFARFLVKFAELAPCSILKQLSLLLDQLLLERTLDISYVRTNSSSKFLQRCAT